MKPVWNIETFDILPSTMDTAHDRARNIAPFSNFVIVAREQNKARGRRGNIWIAPPGNLYCSIVLKPDTDLKDIGQYSFLAATALASIVKPRLQNGYVYKHKWPNDGLINDRKFAGILLESGINDSGENYLVIGIGVNLSSAPEDKICLGEALAHVFGSEEFLDMYLSSLSSHLAVYQERGFKPVREAWLEDARGLYENIIVRLPNETRKGVFTGLDETGALMLGLDHGGQEVIHSGEVFFGKGV
jgi:BirA family biotin operon repressor/biotin-[acetyl-CoA-carboxylase] ligase